MSRLLDLLRARDRPLVLGLLFWVIFAVVAVRYLAQFTREATPLQAWLFGPNMLVLLWLWLILPWDASASRWRKLAAPGFLLATICLGLTGSESVHLPLVLIGLAAVALVYGMTTAVATVLALGVSVVAMHAWLARGDLASAASELIVLSLGAGFTLGMVSAILEARRRREESDRLLQRVRELTVAQERARMARDMHDSIGHHLTVIKMGLENAERFRQRDPEAAWGEVRQSKELTQQALAETRRWVRALRPLHFDGRIGSAALDRLARSFDGSGIAIDFRVEGEERELGADAELVLYRVLQEGLTNVLRHAEANRAHIRLSFDRGRATLVILDDGQGTQADPGFGLTSLAERTEALGGRLWRRNASHGGFELRAELPVVDR